MVSAVGTLELGVKFCSLHTFKSVSYGTAHLRRVLFALFELFAWIHALGFSFAWNTDSNIFKNNIAEVSIIADENSDFFFCDNE